MRKSEIKEYFDTRAADWDRTLIKNDQTIQTILELAGVHSGAHVLDVACGTGVLIPYYLERKVASVTAVDISAEMIRLAQSKFPHDAVRFICGDAEHLTFDRDFDCVVVYNAFPHFPNPARLIQRLSAVLKQGGKLTVAHGMSRAEIDRCHQGSASKVSMGLMHEDTLAGLFEKSLDVCVKLSNDTMYQVTGIKK